MYEIVYYLHFITVFYFCVEKSDGSVPDQILLLGDVRYLSSAMWYIGVYFIPLPSWSQEYGSPFVPGERRKPASRKHLGWGPGAQAGGGRGERHKKDHREVLRPEHQRLKRQNAHCAQCWWAGDVEAHISFAGHF